MDSRVQVTRMQALWRAIHCLDEENAIAAMESAIHTRFLTVAQVKRIGVLAPRRLQPAARRLVPESGSGNETIVRRRIESVGYRVETQAYVPGMGRGDLLVEGCLGLDVDGREWHGEDRYAIDHERDLRAEGLGRHILRISTSQIHVTWPNTIAVIERALNDAMRERDRRNGRIVLGLHDPL
jgi:very-short-patch-repair endonuclease